MAGDSNKSIMGSRFRFMGRCLLLTWLLYLPATAAWAQLQDNFSDGDFSSNPPWFGNTEKFEVNAALQLHLNAPAITDTAYLSTSSTAAYDCEWRFLFILDFAPSGSNYLKVYLMSDQQNLKLPLNGYFIRAGKDGTDDRLQLVRQLGTAETVLIDGTPGTVAANYNKVAVRVTRSADGTFTLYADFTGAGNYQPEGTATDNAVTASQYFGFFCRYTSTRSDKFYFDDVYAGAPIVDTIAPLPVAITPTSTQSLDVLFSEAVENASAQQPINYWINSPPFSATTATLDANNPALVHLTFSQTFPIGSNTLIVSQIADLAGNVRDQASLTFTFYPPKPGDVLINEIMADPSPPAGLPDAEYIELYNASDQAIDLAGWTFSDASSAFTLSGFVLQPGNYLILCDADHGTVFSAYGPVMTHPTFPTLNNSSDNLTLTDAFGNLIDAVPYTDDWYQIPTPAGGISLERIHPVAGCSGAQNWHASLDSSGGTPGKKNSVTDVMADTTAPALVAAGFATHQEVELTFTEPVDSAAAVNLNHYRLETAEGSAWPLQQALPTSDGRGCTLLLANPADSNRIYRCISYNLTDCLGNQKAADTLLLALTLPARAGDIVINEILFNPPTGGSDFVELYNASDRILDLKELIIARADEQDSLITLIPVSSLSRLLLPDQYVALTPDPSWVKQHYFSPNPEGILSCKLPTLPDDAGTVVLLRDTQRLDQLTYADDWHFPLLDEVEGVSLERISPQAPTQDSMNWHSAAASVGYGTPAYRNSQFVNLADASQLAVTPKVFSPDQDGYHDVLVIQYEMDQPGYVMNIRIVDAAGRPVVHLVQNALLDQSGFFVWDGIGADGRNVRMGHYILLAEYFDLDGRVFRHRKLFSVAYRKR